MQRLAAGEHGLDTGERLLRVGCCAGGRLHGGALVVVNRLDLGADLDREHVAIPGRKVDQRVVEDVADPAAGPRFLSLLQVFDRSGGTADLDRPGRGARPRACCRNDRRTSMASSEASSAMSRSANEAPDSSTAAS